MQATVATTLQTAATHLNDSSRQFWPDSILITFLQEAFRDLSNELYLNGLPVIHTTVILLNLPIGQTTVGWNTVPTLPSNIIMPVRLWERPAGSSFDDFVEMIPKSWEPEAEQDENLTYWMWQGQVINLLGATQIKDLRLDYDASLQLPQSDSDPIPFIDGEFFLAPKAAAYAAASIDRVVRAATLHDIADSKLSKIIRANVKNQQNQPVRRRPYRRNSHMIIGR